MTWSELKQMARGDESLLWDVAEMFRRTRGEYTPISPQEWRAAIRNEQKRRLRCKLHSQTSPHT